MVRTEGEAPALPVTLIGAMLVLASAPVKVTRYTVPPTIAFEVTITLPTPTFTRFSSVVWSAAAEMLNAKSPVSCVPLAVVTVSWNVPLVPRTVTSCISLWRTL